MARGNYYYSFEDLNAATQDAKVIRVVNDQREVRYYYDNGVCAVFSQDTIAEIFLDVLYPVKNEN